MRHVLPLLLAMATLHLPQPGPTDSASVPAVLLRSPNGRFDVEFSGPRTRSPDEAEGLWTAIRIRDLSTGTQRTAHVASGQRRSDEIWNAFGVYTESSAWSPDGLYLAYWRFACVDQEGVPGVDAVCHSHDILFLSMRELPPGSRELTLGRYQFAGWSRGRPHTVIQLDPSGAEKSRTLPYTR